MEMEKPAELVSCECGNATFSVVDEDHNKDMMSSTTIACGACEKVLFRIFTPWVSGEIWIEYPKAETS